jgi:hypothetical protein
METIFKIGMKVYDQFVFPGKEGQIIEICDNLDYPIRVSLDGQEISHAYTKDGRYAITLNPSLSTKPYKIEGFSQKPTFNEALKWLRDKYLGESITYKIDGEKYFVDYYYSKNAPYKSFEALRKLIIFRDYYNDGWQPNWKNNNEDKYVILIQNEDIECQRNYGYKRVLAFKTEEIRDKFLEEQKELLEIAKPLL